MRISLFAYLNDSQGASPVDAFVRVHGFTVMEVFGQLRPLVSPADAYYEQLLRELVATLGLEASRASS